MTYATPYTPPPYSAPFSAADPTAVIGRRISAYLIDLVLPTLIAIAIGAVVWFGAAQKYDRNGSDAPYGSCAQANFENSGQSCFETNNQIWFESNSDSSKAVGVGLLIALYVPLNAFLIQGVSGATVGKRILGLRVVRGDGSICGFGWNALRSLLLFIPDGICGGIVGLITVCVTKPHRRVGDMAAGTYVVRTANVGTPVVAQPNYGGVGYGGPAPQPWAGPVAGMAPSFPPASQAWGTQPTAAQPVDIPPTWGVQAAPTDTAPEQSGWAAPQPTPAGVPTTAQEAVTQPMPSAVPQQDSTQPKWDEARQAYIAWEPTRGVWMQHDTTTNEWKPII